MRAFYLLGFLLLVCFDTAGQVGFKLAALGAGPVAAKASWLLGVFAGHWVYLAVAAYVGAFFTWMTLLKHAPVGPSFAASHLDVVTVLVISVAWFHETLSLRQMVGAALILGGVALLAAKGEAPE